VKKVSIITVCYNSEKTIRRTIESVLHQTYPEIEYIVVDGASKDTTMEIVKEYEDAFGSRLHYVSEQDKGIYDAMNKGIRIATGDVIGILNSDDFYEPQAVEHILEAMTEDTYQILYGFVRNLKNGREYSIDRGSPEFLRERMIGHPACFVTKKVYDDFGCFDLQYISVADYDFMLRMQRHREVHFIPIDHLLTNFALGGMSASDAAWLDLLKLRRNYGIISEKQYKNELRKNQLYHIYRKIIPKK